MIEKQMSARQFAAAVGVHKATVLGWIKQGRIPAAVTPTGRIRIPESALEDALRPVVVAKTRGGR